MPLMNLPEYLWILYDLLTLLILIYFVRTCAYKGFVRTLISFAGYLTAAALAGLLGPAAAQLLYTHVVRDALKIVVTGQMEALITEGSGAVSGITARFFPAEILDSIQQNGGDFLEMFFDGDMAALVDTVLDGALQAPVLSILGGVCFFVLFSLSLVFTRRIGRLFGGLYRVPVIGTFNTFLGGVVGVCEGVLVLYLLAILAHVVISLSAGQIAWLSEEVIGDTFIFRVFYIVI